MTATALALYRRSEGERLLALLLGGMLDMAEAGYAAVADMLEEQGIAAEVVVDVDVTAFAGSASDGRPLRTLLELPESDAQLERIVRTQLADAGRLGESLGRFSRPKVTHYVRGLSLPSCGRCVVLAGTPCAADKPFQRHPKCDCISVPTSAGNAEKIATSIDEAVSKMSAAERAHAFTKAGAEAIDLGADVSQVVNARAGMSTAQVGLGRGRWTASGRLQAVDLYGQKVFVTTEGTTRRGSAYKAMRDRGEFGVGKDYREAGKRYFRSSSPRLMPESIIQLANGDREEATRLLRLYGYIR